MNGRFFYCSYDYWYGANDFFMVHPFAGSLLLLVFHSGFGRIKVKFSYELMVE